MAFKKILVAYDGSPDSEKALTMAASLAQDLAAVILLTSVVSTIPVAVSEDMDYSTWETNAEKIYAEKVEAAKKYCQEMHIEIHTKVLHGNPASEIINYARQEKADMIIAGTRGLGGFGQLLLGSVAHQLVTYSDIPVMIVK
ncbi:MAG: nhaX 1 [Firmicutes bacterium]|nr:nhaX 1 [Bacillota bacterium]